MTFNEMSSIEPENAQLQIDIQKRQDKIREAIPMWMTPKTASI